MVGDQAAGQAEIESSKAEEESSFDSFGTLDAAKELAVFVASDSMHLVVQLDFPFAIEEFAHASWVCLAMVGTLWESATVVEADQLTSMDQIASALLQSKNQLSLAGVAEASFDLLVVDT